MHINQTEMKENYVSAMLYKIKYNRCRISEDSTSFSLFVKAGITLHNGCVHKGES